MLRHGPFGRGCALASDDIAERALLADPAKAPGTVLTQTVRHRPIERLAVQTPRFPARPRDDRDHWELILGRLRTITAAEGPDQTNDRSTPVEPSRSHLVSDEGLEERAAGDQHVGTRNQDWEERHRPLGKKGAHRVPVVAGQGSEPRKWLAQAASDSWRLSPHTALAATEFLLLLGRVLKTKGRVGDHAVN